MESSAESGCIDCFDVIGIVFIILKLLAVEPVAHWSWLWVLCPFWGAFGLSCHSSHFCENILIYADS